MLVKSLDVKEFRGIREFKEPLEFKKFNVLICRNNCGKSSIIEALALLPYPELEMPLNDSISRIEYLYNARNSDINSYIFGYSGNAIIKYSFVADFNVTFELSLQFRKYSFNEYNIEPKN